MSTVDNRNTTVFDNQMSLLFCTCSAINLVISSQLWPPLVTCCLISPFSLCHSITFHILEAYKANKSKLWRLLKANEKDDYLFLLIIMNF